MTKRFTNTDNGFIVDYESKQKVLNLYDVVELLNELATKCSQLEKENEQLKQFQTNTFTLINEMIETANLYRTPIKTLDYGDDLGYWNGVYQKLKELRDILENEQTRR